MMTEVSQHPAQESTATRLEKLNRLVHWLHANADATEPKALYEQAQRTLKDQGVGVPNMLVLFTCTFVAGRERSVRAAGPIDRAQRAREAALNVVASNAGDHVIARLEDALDEIRQHAGSASLAYLMEHPTEVQEDLERVLLAHRTAVECLSALKAAA